jgi:hypothetical protein
VADLSQNFDNFDLIVQNFNKFKRPASQNEYEDYITENTIKIDSSPLS